MTVTLTKNALDKLASCFGLNSDQYNAIVSAAVTSPFLAQEINTFGDKDWYFVKGTAGSGTFADSGKKMISFDPSWTDPSTKFVTVVAHELGHALLPGHGRLGI